MIETIKRKNGVKYKVRVWHHGYRKSKTFERMYDAVRYEKEVKENGSLLSQSKLTFFEAAEKWLNEYAKLRKAVSTYLGDIAILNNHIYPVLGRAKLSDIQAQDIDELIVELRKKGLKDATINKNLEVIRSIFNFLLKRRMVFYNPMVAVSFLKTEPVSFKFWTLEEGRRFLEYTRRKYENTEKYANYLLYKIALNCGLRLGELLALKWDCVDFSNRLITVRRTYCKREKRIKETTKGRKIRYVPLNQAILGDLQKQPKNGDLVLHWKGSVIDSDNFRHRYFTKDIKESGISPIRIHDMRHTFASHYMMNGGNIYDLQKILGHRDLKTTERYAHLSHNFIAAKGDIVSFTEEENVVRVDFKAS